MIRFVTVAQARVISGISSTQVSDDDMTQMIEEIEYQAEHYLNRSFSPLTVIDVQDGNSMNAIFTNHSPLLALISLKSNDVSIDVTNTRTTRGGRIRIDTSNSGVPGVFTRIKEGVVIKYLTGDLAWDRQNQTTTTAATTVGSSVAISVSDESGFTTNDYIEISGTDRTTEAAKITGTSSNTITVDNLYRAHESGSLVNLLKLDLTIRRYMEVLVAIGANIRAVGESFDDITGYTIGEFQVQKGEPFTQFREAINQFIKERDILERKIGSKPGIVV